MKLYKYRPFKTKEDIEHVYDILEKNRLYCANPDTFNDPLETLCLIKYLVGEKRSFHRERHVGSSYLLGDWKYINSLAPEAKDIMDLIKRKKVCALSANGKDVVMWAHYADKHAGVVIEMDIPDKDIAFIAEREKDRASWNKKKIFEVEYFESLRQVIDGPNSKIRNEQAIKVLATKINHWEYEAEFRIVQEQESYFVLPRKIDKVYCGLKSEGKNFGLIREAFPHIHFVELELDRKFEEPWIKERECVN